MSGKGAQNFCTNEEDPENFLTFKNNLLLFLIFFCIMMAVVTKRLSASIITLIIDKG
jgi:hypothetical protein